VHNEYLLLIVAKMNAKSGAPEGKFREFCTVEQILALQPGGERAFVIALLPEFEVEVFKNGGLKLSVDVSKNFLGIRNTLEKQKLTEISKNSSRQGEFPDLLHPRKHCKNKYEYKGEPYFRWVSGGCLPIISIENKRYCLLFFRDIHVRGWNVANGASENEEEFWNLDRLFERESKEELIITNRFTNSVYPLLYPSGHLDSTTRQATHDFIKGTLVKLGLALKVSDDDLVGKPLPGPDVVKVNANWEESGTHIIDNVYISINPDEGDMAIEVIKIMEWTIEDSLEQIVCYDGEIHENWNLDDGKKEGMPVNRPVGLFDLKQLAKGFKGNERPPAVPQMVFTNGECLKGEKLQRWMEENQYSRDWCPVTRKTLFRYFKHNRAIVFFDIEDSDSRIFQLIVEIVLVALASAFAYAGFNAWALVFCYLTVFCGIVLVTLELRKSSFKKQASRLFWVIEIIIFVLFIFLLDHSLSKH
jgi:hypothetical protein